MNDLCPNRNYESPRFFAFNSLCRNQKLAKRKDWDMVVPVICVPSVSELQTVYM